MTLIDKDAMMDLLPLACERRFDEMTEWARTNVVDNQSAGQFFVTAARWVGIMLNVVRGDEPGAPPADGSWVIESSRGSLGNEPDHQVARLIASAMNGDTDHLIGISAAVVEQDEVYVGFTIARMMSALGDAYEALPKPTGSGADRG